MFLDLIYQNKGRCFDGYIPIYFRDIQEIGRLRLKISITKDAETFKVIPDEQRIILDYWEEPYINIFEIHPSSRIEVFTAEAFSESI